MNNKLFKDSINLFEASNEDFIKNNDFLFYNNVSERTLCGALMLEIYNRIQKSFKEYRDYFVDVEYNRAKNGEVKHCVKTIKGHDERIIQINCDLIIHGRGMGKVVTENLIAIEMKKNYRKSKDKLSDKERLIALTAPLEEVYCWSPKVNPKIVCGYILGVYYEINSDKREIKIEYYKDGKIVDEKTIYIDDYVLPSYLEF